MKKKVAAWFLTGVMAMSLASGALSVRAEETVDLPECTVTFLHNGTADSEAQMWDDFADEFMEKYPQVTIEIQNGGSDYYSVLATRINADEVPDIYITGGFDECNTYEDYLYDFRDDPDLYALFDRVNTDQYKSVCIADDGKVVGIPGQTTAYGMVYNKDLFEQAGITELPATIDEMRDVCEKLTAAGITPFCDGYKEWWIVRHTYSSYVGSSFDDMATEMAPALTDHTVTFKDLKHMDEMFDFLDLVIEYGTDNKIMEMDAATATAAFASGKGAMQNQGTWNYGAYVDINPDIRVGFIPEPYADPADTKLISYVAGTLSISNDPANFEATKAFYLFMIDKLCTTEAGVNQKCLQLPETDTSLLTNQLMLDAFERGDNVRMATQNFWPVSFDLEFGPVLQEYAVGNLTREECLEQLQITWDNNVEG